MATSNAIATKMEIRLRMRSTATSSFVLLLFLLQTHVISTKCFEFSKSYFSVEFIPYEHNNNRSHDPQAAANIKNKLRVISRKFWNIYTTETEYRRSEDVRNNVYTRGVLATGEAAAALNKKKNFALLSMIIQVEHYESATQFKSAVLRAYESAEKANKIYPGTVKGVSLFNDNGKYESTAQRNLEYLKELKSNASHLGIQLGVAVTCNHFLDPNFNSTFQIEKEIVIHADFIVCSTILTKPITERGPEYCFSRISDGFLKAKTAIKQINPKPHLIGMTAWEDSKTDLLETVEAQNIFWEMASTWAAEYKIMVVMKSAFDDQYSRQGWFVYYPSFGAEDVYIEKVSVLDDQPHPTDETTMEDEGINTEHDGTTEAFYSTSFAHSSAISTRLVGILVGAGVVIWLVTTVIAVFIVRFRRMKKTATLKEFELSDLSKGTCDLTSNDDHSGSGISVQNAIRSQYDRSYEFSLEMLRTDKSKLLGKGEFGCVYKATLFRGDAEMEVAIKMIRRGAPDSAIKNLLSEIKILTYLGKHDNIVTLKGAYTAELANGLVYLATELSSLGSLECYLRKGKISADNGDVAGGTSSDYVESMHSFVSIRLWDMLKWSHEIACGMEYLATKCVVHADLATRNVLLTSHRIAKISDFGLSRRMNNYRNYVKTGDDHLPWRWMAIESLKKFEFSTQSDVWGYGVTLWEIFSMGNAPYLGFTCSANFVNILFNGYRLQSPKYASDEVFNIMIQCWHVNPKERPTFRMLREHTCRLLSQELTINE